MKCFSKFALYLLLFKLLALPAYAVHYKVFLLGGQSNMVGRGATSELPAELQVSQSDVLLYEFGSLAALQPSGTNFGPEITFGRHMADRYPDEHFALIKSAAGGTDLANDWDPETGAVYTSFRNAVTNGIAALKAGGNTTEIVGMLWTQGERDARLGRSTQEYTDDLIEFIADIRTRYGTALPFFLSRLSIHQTDLPSDSLAGIRAAQEAVAAADLNAYLIDTDECALSNDNLHFSAIGQMALGEAFSDTYLRFMNPVNILFITADDLNHNIATYGHPVAQTPNLDTLASQSVKFERAYCQWPVCGPSRASFLTGLYPDQTNIKDLYTSVRETLPDAVTLPQYFINNGYQVARVGKLYHMSNPNALGTNGEDDPQSWQERYNPVGVDNSTEVQDEIFILKNDGSGWKAGGWRGTGARLSYLPAEGLTSNNIDKADPLNHSDGMVATKAIELIDAYTDSDQPFFLAVGFYKPHTPFVAPKKYFDLYDPDDIILPVVPDPISDYHATLPSGAVYSIRDHWPEQRQLSEVIARQTILSYYATISFLDDQLGRVIAALDDPNGDGDTSDSVRDHTIIVFLSDHGYHMGEHDHYQKTTMFELATRTPLMICAPGAPANGQSTQSIVELVDLYKTVADLAALPEPDAIEGVSLAPVLQDATSQVRDSALSQIEFSNPSHIAYTLRTDRYRLTRWDNGGSDQVELYDHLTDPDELNNLAYSAPSTYAGLIASLENELDLRIAEASTTVVDNPFPETVSSTPYTGSNTIIPGRLEAEDYDLGGEGVAYHDTTAGNSLTGTAYRNEDVDIAICSDAGGGYNIGGLAGNEWLAYTVNLAPGIYDIHFRMASANTGVIAGLDCFLEGALVGSVDGLATGGWQSWQTATLTNVEVKPGGADRKLVLRRTSGGQIFNLNWIEFELKQTNLTLWKTQFDEVSPVALADESDSDGDGFTTVFEYLFDTDPTNTADFPIAAYEFNNVTQRASLSYPRQHLDSSLTYAPQWSTNLIQWHETEFVQVSQIDLGAIEQVSYAKAMDAGGQMFLRVCVSGF
ncbi:sulfatase-like hydrolase/transferase [Coraliomargarita parva]|uniref:sulfatase-like hydrolase/transferase n=1 Tax=Coraliomargarita parva TaxID=3014050 RepID=UPI0022B40EE8|nr:sulfatase-like hydrolase/transferase [Coraliomargarita parva]